MEYNIDDHISAVKAYDFWSENRETFYEKLNNDSILYYGEYSKHIPQVSILITTCKRVETLQYALESALNQREFYDYEIVVVDNEAADIKKETDTSRYIKSIKSDKILYYRNQTSAEYRMDTGIAVVRTPWVCFLHDDDILSPWTLKILTDIQKKNLNSMWIDGYMRGFNDKDMDNIWKKRETKPIIVSIAQYPNQYYRESHKPSWAGSLINVERYISHGGTPAISLENGDSVMSIRFACIENVICVKTNLPLYNYRIWKKSVTGSGVSTIEKMLVSDYLFRCYVLDKYQVCNSWFWKMCAWRKLVNDVNNYKTNIYKYTDLNIEYLADKLEIPKWWCSKKMLQKYIENILRFYEKRYLKCIKNKLNSEIT